MNVLCNSYLNSRNVAKGLDCCNNMGGNSEEKREMAGIIPVPMELYHKNEFKKKFYKI